VTDADMNVIDPDVIARMPVRNESEPGCVPSPLLWGDSILVRCLARLVAIPLLLIAWLLDGACGFLWSVWDNAGATTCSMFHPAICIMPFLVSLCYGPWFLPCILIGAFSTECAEAHCPCHQTIQTWNERGERHETRKLAWFSWFTLLSYTVQGDDQLPCPCPLMCRVLWYLPWCPLEKRLQAFAATNYRINHARVVDGPHISRLTAAPSRWAKRATRELRERRLGQFLAAASDGDGDTVPVTATAGASAGSDSEVAPYAAVMDR
jgi:hypothetical protein